MTHIRHPAQSHANRDRMPESAQDGCRHKVGRLSRQDKFPPTKNVFGTADLHSLFASCGI